MKYVGKVQNKVTGQEWATGRCNSYEAAHKGAEKLAKRHIPEDNVFIYVEEKEGVSDEVLDYIKKHPGCKAVNVWMHFNRVINKSIHTNSAIQYLRKKGRICVDKDTQPHRYYHPSFFQENPPETMRQVLTMLSQYSQKEVSVRLLSTENSFGIEILPKP